MIIAVNGKGGTGKTTVSALLVKELAGRGAGSILAIDADPNSCFAGALGIQDAQTVVGICDEISKDINKIPGGMTKDRYIEMRVQDAVIERDDFDLLVMGRPEGPGCYCYVNSLLRSMIDRITKNYNFTVIDNAAGMEHISRRTAANIDRLVIVSDYSVSGLGAAKKIYELAKSLSLKIGSAWLVINKASGSLTALNSRIDDTALAVAGVVGYEEAVVRWSLSAQSVFELESETLKSDIAKIVDKLLR